ncbi:hypothetical protein TNCV_1522031 [Trichonephila clavipes]|nr:hypothetical protein TNCV_1522031 [Trichonephila clavipes]
MLKFAKIVKQKEQKEASPVILLAFFYFRFTKTNTTSVLVKADAITLHKMSNFTYARKICRELKRPSVGVVFRRGRGQLRCRPRHLTMVQNYEAHHQKSSCS